MRKIDEIERSDSCWNKAGQTERVFVLLGRDVASPDTIRFWCAERIRKGKNTWSDDQIKEALALAESIEAELRLKAEQQAELDKLPAGASPATEEEIAAGGSDKPIEPGLPGEPIPEDPTGTELLDAIPPGQSASNELQADLDAGKKSDANTDDAQGYDAGGRLDT